MADEFLTLAALCIKYHVSDRRAREIVKVNAIPVLCPGREWLFDHRAEAAFCEATRKVWSKPEKVAPARGRGGKPVRGGSDLSAYEQARALIADARLSRPGRKPRSA